MVVVGGGGGGLEYGVVGWCRGDEIGLPGSAKLLDVSHSDGDMMEATLSVEEQIGMEGVSEDGKLGE